MEEEKVLTEEEQKKKSKKVFALQLALFLAFCLVIPVIYFAIRFNLFTQITKTQIGLWGVILIIIIFAIVVVLIKFYLAGLKTKWTLLKQIVEGLVKLILPLIVVQALLILMKNDIDKLVECMWVFLPCELVAIVVNPLPKWCFDNNVDGLGEITDKVFKRGDN